MNSGVDIKAVQSILLDIIGTVHNILQQANIPYCMIGGTMLGAMRHGGFIPWDDDIDIGVPRASFKKMKKVLKENLPPFYVLKDRHNLEESWSEILKIEDSRTHVKERTGGGKTREHGVFIDIFPLDLTNSDRTPFLSQNWFVEHLLMLECIRTRNDHSLKTLLAKLFSLLFGQHVFIMSVGRIASFRHSGKFVANYSGAYGMREIFKKEIVGNPTLYQFEGMQLYGVEKPHEYLTKLYGDYMALPPVEKRRIHIIDLTVNN